MKLPNRKLILCLVLALFLTVGHYVAFEPKEARMGKESDKISDFVLFEANTLKAVAQPCELTFEVLGSLLSEYDLNENQRYVAENFPDLYWKVYCENRPFNPKSCDILHNCEYGMGMSHIIRKTWNSTLDRIAKAEDYLPERCFQKLTEPISEGRIEMIFDMECNLRVAQWLYEHEGSDPWGTVETEWGTYSCWSTYEQ